MLPANPAAFNADKLARDIRGAASMMLGVEVEKIPGYDEKLVAKITQYAANFAVSLKSGRITGSTRDFMAEGLRTHIRAFVGALQSGNLIALNKAHFGVSFVVFKTISDASGVEVKP